MAVYATPSLRGPCASNAAVVCVPPSGSIFPLGTSFVTCTSTNGAGVHVASCSFPVVIVKAAFTIAFDFLPVTITGSGPDSSARSRNGVITVTNTGGPFLA